MSKGQRTIMIVDDDSGINKMLTFLFIAKGFKVRCAENGKNALKILKDCEPDAIILDVNMPNMDGLEVCKNIKNNSDFKDIPIIFLSALSANILKDQALSLGAFDFIEKPFLTKNLVDRVNAAIH